MDSGLLRKSARCNIPIGTRLFAQEKEIFCALARLLEADRVADADLSPGLIVPLDNRHVSLVLVKGHLMHGEYAFGLVVSDIIFEINLLCACENACFAIEALGSEEATSMNDNVNVEVGVEVGVGVGVELKIDDYEKQWSVWTISCIVPALAP